MNTKDVLLELRTKNNLSQDDLAEKVFVTRQAVSRWENGDTVPNTETLKLLSNLYNVSINTLLGSPHKLICQCCGMPLEDSIIGRNKDGSFNEDYCKWCYADGTYTYSDMDNLIEVCIPNMVNENFTEDQAREYLKQELPKLDYWKKTMLLGILSDTHGLLRQEVIDGFKGVDHIIHAGDIDNKAVINRLKEIAPVTVVRGNADKEWAEYLPETAIEEFLGNKIYVIHNKGKINNDLARISIIIYGHSHKYSLVDKDGLIWFNPGCCGKRKPDQEVSFAILEISGPGEFEFRKRVIDNASQDSKLPKDIEKIISKAMDMTDKGKSHKVIAKKLKITEELAENICRMYLTHPGVDVAGILQRIS